MFNDWALDLRTSIWTRHTERNWEQWTLRRTDKKHSLLFNLRHAAWLRETRWKDEFEKRMRSLEAHIGRAPDLDLLPFLYRPDESVTELPRSEDEYNVFRVLVDGTIVRFTEENRLVRVVVEGRLSDARLRVLQESVRDKLATLEGGACEIETL